MAHEYLSGDRDQAFLLPPSMRDWLPEDHLVWFVIDLVSELDLSGFARDVADPRGRRRYDPAVLVTVLVYAYCVGERSSRRIEQRCVEDVAFRVAAADLAPDHTTISRFLKDHAAAFDALFTQVLAVAAAAGAGKVGVVHLDGTKVAADASPRAARTKEAIAAEVARITAEARAVDAAEDERFGDARGDELPAELADPRSRKARLRAALERAEADEVVDAKRAPVRRRGPGKVNITDPQSRVMKGPKGHFPAYNTQAAATEDGLIVAADVTDEVTDHHQFVPMVDQACGNTLDAGLGALSVVCADNGYWTNDNATYQGPMGASGPEPLIAPRRDPRCPPIATRGPIPAGASTAQIMHRRLVTNPGAKIYRRRGPTIEAIFGHLKAVRGISRFRRRGLDAARHEWRLAATTHNILKLWRLNPA